jgi:phosphate transport system substrate-binding protein
MAVLLPGCSPERPGRPPEVTTTLRVDGSSTVYLISEAVAEEFQKANPDIRVTVGISGSGGGFKKFCNGETDISDASRRIKPDELATCRANDIEPIELVIGLDGISVVANPENDFISCLSVAELRRIWEPGSTVTTWRDVRPEWPDEGIVLYGPGSESGTFDYFTQVIMGEEDASRLDFAASEDDNVLVLGVAGDRYSLGYFGYAYYVENTDKLKLVAIDDGGGCVLPSPETVRSREYAPLFRPLFLYVNNTSLKRPRVKEFVQYYLIRAAELIPQVGYIALTPDRYRTRLDEIEWRSRDP